jgi:hypothetical protein
MTRTALASTQLDRAAAAIANGNPTRAAALIRRAGRTLDRADAAGEDTAQERTRLALVTMAAVS